MKKHKYNIYPEMQPDEYGELLTDIKMNGYDASQPIYIYDGDILDGWNRQRACNELGVTPNYETFEGSNFDAIMFVIRTNKRRNLNSSQKACIAAEADEIIKVIAEQVEEERRQKISENNNNQYTYESAMAQLIAPSQNTEKEAKETRTKVAKMFDTNRQYVSDAIKLKETDPEIFEDVKAGIKTIPEVKREQKIENFEANKIKFQAQIQVENIEQQIIHGDCLDVLPTLKEGDYSLLLTDMPYGMNFKSGWSNKRGIKNDSIESAKELLHKTLLKAVPLLKDEAHFYIFGNINYILDIKPIIEKYLVLKNILIWDRGVIGMGDLNAYGNSYDIIYFGYNKKWFRNLNGVRDRDVLRFNRVAPANNIHPTEKPIDLIEFLIKKSTQEKDKVLDPFAGGGSTLLACKNTNRLATGIEIELEYVNLIKARI